MPEDLGSSKQEATPGADNRAEAQSPGQHRETPIKKLAGRMIGNARRLFPARTDATQTDSVRDELAKEAAKTQGETSEAPHIRVGVDGDFTTPGRKAWESLSRQNRPEGSLAILREAAMRRLGFRR